MWLWSQRTLLLVTVARWLLMVKFIKRLASDSPSHKKMHAQKEADLSLSLPLSFSLHKSYCTHVTYTRKQMYLFMLAASRCTLSPVEKASASPIVHSHRILHTMERGQLCTRKAFVFTLAFYCVFSSSLLFSLLLPLCLCSHNCYKHSFVRCMDSRTLQQTLLLLSSSSSSSSFFSSPSLYFACLLSHFMSHLAAGAPSLSLKVPLREFV